MAKKLGEGEGGIPRENRKGLILGSRIQFCNKRG